MICLRRSGRRSERDAGERAQGRAEPPPDAQAPPPVFRARHFAAFRAPDRRGPHGGSGAGGGRGQPAAQGHRQTLHLVSGAEAPAARELRGGGGRADSGAGSGGATCAPGMLVFTWLCAELRAPPSAPS